MSGSQSAVLWLGLFLIAARLVFTDQWSELWSTLKSSTSQPAPSNNPTNNPKVLAPGVNPATGQGAKIA